MYGINKVNFLILNIKMEPLWNYLKDKELIVYRNIIQKVMHGIIDLMYLMIHKDWFHYLVGNKLLLRNWINFLNWVDIGEVSGCLILIIGLEISIICLLFGCLVLLIDLIWLRNIVEWLWRHNMVHKGMDYLEMMIMAPCQLGTSLLL